MRVLSYDDDFLPRVSIKPHYNDQQQRRRHHRRGSSCCGFPISPNLVAIADGFSRNSFSYDRIPQHPLHLTVRKLDGSSFDVEVAKGATVAELKQAVEGVFGFMPREGDGKISWSHVWLHFCLSYDGWKLLTDSEPISNYGISDGDQIHFVRHVSINYNIVRKRSKDKLSALDQPNISDGFMEREENGEKSNDQENSKHHHYDDGDETITRCYESEFARVFGGWFSYRKLGSGKSFSSRLADGFLGSFRSILRLCSSKKQNPRKDPLEEV